MGTGYIHGNSAWDVMLEVVGFKVQGVYGERERRGGDARYACRRGVDMRRMCVDSGNGSEGAVEEGQTSRCRIVAGLDGLGTRSWWLLDRPSTSKLKKVGR